MDANMSMGMSINSTIAFPIVSFRFFPFHPPEQHVSKVLFSKSRTKNSCLSVRLSIYPCRFHAVQLS